MFILFFESCVLFANWLSFLCSMAATNAGRIDHTHPGPIDDSVLTLQPIHRSEVIWKGQVKHNTTDLTNVHTFNSYYHFTSRPVIY